MSAASAGIYRTEVMRMWTTKAIELKEKEKDLHDNMPEHIGSVLKGKKLEVFRAMLEQCNYGDKCFYCDIVKGFDLMGQLPILVSSKNVALILLSPKIKSAKSANKRVKLSGILQGLWWIRNLLKGVSSNPR